MPGVVAAAAADDDDDDDDDDAAVWPKCGVGSYKPFGRPIVVGLFGAESCQVTICHDAAMHAAATVLIPELEKKLATEFFLYFYVFFSGFILLMYKEDRTNITTQEEHSIHHACSLSSFL